MVLSLLHVRPIAKQQAITIQKNSLHSLSYLIPNCTAGNACRINDRTKQDNISHQLLNYSAQDFLWGDSCSACQTDTTSLQPGREAYAYNRIPNSVDCAMAPSQQRSGNGQQYIVYDCCPFIINSLLFSLFCNEQVVM